MWEVEYTNEFGDWWNTLTADQQEALDDRGMLLADHGPALCRPVVGAITGSRHSNMKELRASAGGGSLRVLFAFDPRRQVILLLGGDKSGQWDSWYEWAIPTADRLYDTYLQELRREGLIQKNGESEQNMVNANCYKQLHDQVIARPGAVERLAALRQETLAEIGLYEMRRQLDCSQSRLAAALGISQAAVSQLENAQDMTLSRLQKYLEPLGATLRVHAVFDNGEEEYSIPIRVGRRASEKPQRGSTAQRVDPSGRSAGQPAKPMP